MGWVGVRGGCWGGGGGVRNLSQKLGWNSLENRRLSAQLTIYVL